MKKFLILPFAIVIIMMSCCTRGRRTTTSARHSRPGTEQQTSSRTRNRARAPESVSKPRVVASTDSSSKELSGTEIFERYNMAVFTIFTSDGHSGSQGSGFFISSDGLAVSNYHVFRGSRKGLEKIKLADGSVHEVSEVVAYNEKDDIFVFRVKGHSFTSIPISKRKVRVGEKAYAIGSPRGLENTFSSGEISQLREGFIQISVPIDHGSSGGVLLNSYGEAIGITTAGYDNSGANLNFAVDIHVIEKYLNLSANRPATQSTNTSWSDAEIAQANTAAYVSSTTQMERDVIFYCNLARLDGAKFWTTYGKQNAKGSKEYVASLESDLLEVKNLAMLIPEKSLTQAATYHAEDMSRNNFFEHTSSDGTSFGDRTRRFYRGGYMGENLSAGVSTALGVVMQLLVDDGISSLGHRRNILDEGFNAIGVKTATHKRWGTVTVQDFGGQVIDEME